MGKTKGNTLFSFCIQNTMIVKIPVDRECEVWERAWNILNWSSVNYLKGFRVVIHACDVIHVKTSHVIEMELNKQVMFLCIWTITVLCFPWDHEELGSAIKKREDVENSSNLVSGKLVFIFCFLKSNSRYIPYIRLHCCFFPPLWVPSDWDYLRVGGGSCLEHFVETPEAISGLRKALCSPIPIYQSLPWASDWEVVVPLLIPL